ncbi:hypothetical protein [Streptomyces sp. NPDC010273]|uniref:hypothetical protein n=1 Tax=Streptomyces sp. NPDC010273 TaxID=3364829 RepID=UPI0036E56D01
MADRITSSGCAAASIDGPFHGERVASPLTPAECQSRIAAEGVDRVLDRMADDWVAARDLLVKAGIADPTRQAYFGLSMATRFGAAAAVALTCAVFGSSARSQQPPSIREFTAAARIDRRHRHHRTGHVARPRASDHVRVIVR